MKDSTANRLTASSLTLLSFVLLLGGVPSGVAKAGVLGPPIPVSDIATTPEEGLFQLTLIGDGIYFDGPGTGSIRSIWRLRDGTLEKLPAYCDGDIEFVSHFTPLPGAAAIFLSDGCEAQPWPSLWRLDLTNASAVQLNSSGTPLSTEEMIRVGTTVHFRRNFLELWVSDGTSGGSHVVTSDGVFETTLAALPDGARSLFMGGNPWSLWVSDGTAPGTFSIAAVVPDSMDPFGRIFYPTRSGLVFAGNNPDEGSEIWVSDGTPSGTQRLTSLRPGIENAQIANPVACRGVLYFRSRGLGPGSTEIGYELWRSDGTIAGTGLAFDWVEGEGSSSPSPIGCLGDRLVMLASVSQNGPETLWTTDGTLAGTIAVSPLASSYFISPAVEFHGYLFFSAGQDSDGTEVWVTDGTAAGTYKTGDIAPGKGGSDPLFLTPLGDSLYFTADDGTSGREIWRLLVDPALVFRDGFESGMPNAWNEPVSN